MSDYDDEDFEDDNNSPNDNSKQEKVDQIIKGKSKIVKWL
jgi:hypothetical protein